MLAAICGGVTSVFLAALFWSYTLQLAEFQTQDARARLGTKTPINTNLVLIGIDRAYEPSFFSTEEIKEKPVLELLSRSGSLNRRIWAELVEQLAQAGAQAIVLDLVFANPGEGDEYLGPVLQKYRDKVVVGWSIQQEQNSQSYIKLIPQTELLGLPTNGVVELDDRVGFVSIFYDSDGVLRRARYRLDGEHSNDVLEKGVVAESLMARTLRKMGKPELIPPGFSDLRFRWTRQPGLGYSVQPLGEVLSPKFWHQKFQDGKFFRNKVVLIGATSELAHDMHPTPFKQQQETVGGRTHVFSNEMLGPEIQLNILGAALNRAFLKDTSLALDACLIALTGLGAFGLCLTFRQAFRRLLVFAVALLSYWLLGQWLFDHADLVIPVAAPMGVLAGSGILALGYDYLAEQLERARTRSTLERYVSKNVVKELLDNPATFLNSLKGKRQQVTVLFSDIRSFTNMTEGADPEKLVAQLNEYFEVMVDCVFSEQGTLDKFIGDAVMAVWGNIVAPGTENDSNRLKLEAQHAVATAMKMKRGLARLNEDWEKRGMPRLAFGIGINHGEAIVGNLGSRQKMDPTVIGDAINLGSRLEGLTKRYHLDLLLGEQMAPLVSDRFVLRSVDLVAPKGKSKPGEVFTVVCERSEPLDAAKKEWLQDYAEGVKLFRQRGFVDALARFEKCLRTTPEDYLCSMYAKGCSILIQNPPDASWNGVSVMTEK